MLKALDSFNIVTHIEKAEQGKMYYCQICKQPVLQRRGDIRIHHFAHYSPKGFHGGYVPCSDTWSYDMTEWHMEWQNKFEYSCVEKVVEENGKKHIADIAVGNIVVEFQHSPISIEDFRDRNEFFASKGYKVIWVFDLVEEFDNQRIRLDESNESCYHWAYVKKLFHDVNIGEEKATIYFQFSDNEDEECGVLERVTKSYDDFRLFYTDVHHSLSIPEFIDYVKQNSKYLFPAPKLKPAPESINGGKSVYGLWKPNYTGMIIKNLSNDKVMIINGKDGHMHHSMDSLNRIIGKFCYLDFQTNRYKSKGDYYVVWDEDKEIWQLIFAYEDKEYEKKQEQKKKDDAERLERIRKENEYLNSIPVFLEGCFTLDEITRFNKELTMTVKNMHNQKTYILYFVSILDTFLNRYKAYQTNEATGEISQNLSNEELNKFASRKIWKKVF